jgi:hypothetical protein
MAAGMRRRFRIKNQFFAAETSRAGDCFEVKVFGLKTRDGYFKEESLKPVLRLRGNDELELLLRAVAEMESLLLTDRNNDECQALQNPDGSQRRTS